jgi:pyridoxine 5-phosphate synthase
MIRLGVNIDHVATVRQARGGLHPDPLEAALLCERAGAHGITVHLREDRRHIQPEDLIALKKNLTLPLNVEMTLSKKVIDCVLKITPHMITLVPERREERTTEDGLNVRKYFEALRSTCEKFQAKNVRTSIFIRPTEDQVQACAELKADFVELHTGEYAEASTKIEQKKQWNRLKEAAKLAQKLGLRVNAGHGLNYSNVFPITKINGLYELNIGHAIVSRAVFIGIEAAVREMLACISHPILRKKSTP